VCHEWVWQHTVMWTHLIDVTSVNTASAPFNSSWHSMSATCVCDVGLTGYSSLVTFLHHPSNMLHSTGNPSINWCLSKWLTFFGKQFMWSHYSFPLLCKPVEPYNNSTELAASGPSHLKSTPTYSSNRIAVVYCRWWLVLKPVLCNMIM